MPWSTRQLAELAGSTIKAVRHYHDIGLLDVPERASNGYKQYNVEHLVRLMQIKRLSDLGVPLSRIATMDRADENPDEAIRVLDAELAATVDRLNRVRAELAVLLEHRAPMHLPAEVAPVSHTLSQTQQAMLMVYSTVLSDDAMREFHQALAEPDDTDKEFERLPADADDELVEQLARRMAPIVRESYDKYPNLMNAVEGSPRGAARAANTMAHAVAEFYNTAQIRVLQRLNDLLKDG